MTAELTSDEVPDEAMRLAVSLLTVMGTEATLEAAVTIVDLVTDAINADPRILGALVITLVAWCNHLLDEGPDPDETRAEALVRMGLSMAT